MSCLYNQLEHIGALNTLSKKHNYNTLHTVTINISILQLSLCFSSHLGTIQSLSLTHGCCYAITFWIQKTADLSQIAVPLYYVIQHCRFHEKCIIAFQNSLYSFLIRGDKDWRFFILHESPHLLVCLYHWVLWIPVDTVRELRLVCFGSVVYLRFFVPGWTIPTEISKLKHTQLFIAFPIILAQ